MRTRLATKPCEETHPFGQFGVPGRPEICRRVPARLGSSARVGNIYVNRDVVGAVVGVQPFGGMGLSGTGPKAGGPHYLHRYAVEKTVTINTTAKGGNLELLRSASA